MIAPCSRSGVRRQPIPGLEITLALKEMPQAGIGVARQLRCQRIEPGTRTLQLFQMSRRIGIPQRVIRHDDQPLLQSFLQILVHSLMMACLPGRTRRTLLIPYGDFLRPAGSKNYRMPLTIVRQDVQKTSVSKTFPPFWKKGRKSKSARRLLLRP
mgnify:CR=1 FL=1